MQSIARNLSVLCTKNYQNRWTYDKLTVG